MDAEADQGREELFDRLREGLSDLPDPVPAIDETADEPGEGDEEADVAEFSPLDEMGEVRDIRGPASVTLSLHHPFLRKGRRVRRVDLNPPRHAQVLAVLAGALRHTQLFADMAGLEEGDILALRWPDAARVIKACHGLTPDLSEV